MEIICFDMEGTLTPEIWEQVARNTGIEDFNKTTRDIPSYSELMDFRLNLMQEHDLKLSDIQSAAAQLELLPGALDFLNRIRQNFQVVILSDTFHEIASPLMEKVNAIGHIIYWTYGQRWLHSKFPISDKYDYSKMETPAAICMYVVPLAYAIGLGLDMTVEIACHIRMCCCKGKTAVDENKNK